MTRWKAASLHLLISLVIGIAAFCLLYFVYYPQPFFKAAGADQLVMILLGVDVVLGPLLTLAVFKSGKKSLKFDLGVIAALQMGALIYGLHVMWVARPVYVVAVVDRLEIVYANELEPERLAEAEITGFKKIPLWGPKFITTRRPKPGKEQEMLMDAVFSGLDVRHFPKFYVQATNENLQPFKDRLLTADTLPKAARDLALSTIPNAAQYRYTPLKGRSDEFTVVLDDRLQIQSALPVSAWP